VKIDTDRTNATTPSEDNDVNDAMPGRKIAARLPRLATTVLFLLGLLLCCAGVVSLSHGTAQNHEEGAVLVDEAVKSFGEAPSKTRVAVTFALTNRSSRSVRIVGATPFCCLQGCLAIDQLPFDIPPSSKRDLVVIIETREPGDFLSEVTLFSRGTRQAETVLSINGRVVGTPQNF
jgi:hypothetical protein